ncbi:hypothetical protein V461_05950 [Pantoea ananatis BRT98]|nr:hypothetical protein V461_05950 [Pantoea ananatis BRT98]
MNKLIYPVTVCCLCFLIFPVSRKGSADISCKADVSYLWNEERLDLLISQDLDHGKGVISVSGISYISGKPESYLNKSISFSYLQHNDFYTFRSEMIMDSPQMTMSVSEQRKWLPAFFIKTDEKMLLKIRPYGKNAWLFYSANNPLLVCEKNR